MSPEVSPTLVEWSAVILGNLLISHRFQHQDGRLSSNFINVALRNCGGEAHNKLRKTRKNFPSNLRNNFRNKTRPGGSTFLDFGGLKKFTSVHPHLFRG